jgi:thiamine kinase-like enzyme
MPPEPLETLARRHVPGEGPIVVDRLGTGLVNESYRVARGGQVYSLRVPAPHAAELGPDRGWECRVLECAVAAGIAPVVECCEPCRGILVARWVDGRPWTPEQVRRPENIDQIAHLARRVHALVVPQGARVMSPSDWIAYYYGALERHGVDANHPPGHAGIDLKSEAKMRLAALGELAPAGLTLCHSDLHLQNVVVGAQGPVLLDWEYAHVSEPLWDLAGWSSNNDLCPDVERLLLDRYLQGQSTRSAAQRLPLLVWLYDCVCLLWSLLYMKLRADRPDDGIFARTQLLAARLERDSR